MMKIFETPHISGLKGGKSSYFDILKVLIGNLTHTARPCCHDA